MATTPAGGVYAAWRHVYPGNVRDIAFIASSDGGRRFAAPARVSVDDWHLAGCPDDGPAMAVDGEGTAHLGVADGDGRAGAGRRAFYASSATAGRSRRECGFPRSAARSRCIPRCWPDAAGTRGRGVGRSDWRRTAGCGPQPAVRRGRPADLRRHHASGLTRLALVLPVAGPHPPGPLAVYVEGKPGPRGSRCGCGSVLSRGGGLKLV